MPSYCATAAVIVTPLLTSSTRRHSLHRCTACSALFVAPPWLVTPPLPFVVAPPLPSSSCRFCLCQRATSLLIIAPPLPSLSRHRFCLCRRAASAFLVAPPLPSSSPRRFCLRRRAACSAFIVASLVLPSLSRHRCLPCKHCLPCCAAAAFIVAPPLPSSSPYLTYHTILRSIY